MALSERTVAEISMAGHACDAVGGLYLAYDVFRRHAGPLGLLTRGVSYGVVTALPGWLALGPAFGAISGAGIGLLLAFDYWALARRQRLQRSSPLVQPWWSGASRGAVLGLACVPRYGQRFGLLFAVCAGTLGALVYGAGLIPTFHTFRARRVTLPPAAVKGAVFRALALGSGAALAGVLYGQRELAVKVVVTIPALIAALSIALAAIAPFVEFWIENAPESFFIWAGLLLLCLGLTCDTIPDLAVLLSR